MTQGMYSLIGGAVDRIRVNVTGAGNYDVAGSTVSRTPVIWFQITEVSGTPAVAWGIYNSLTTAYTSLHKSAALTAGQEILREHGIMLEKGEFLRIVAAGGSFDVAGQTLLGGALDS
jgi:hypothetical protein